MLSACGISHVYSLLSNPGLEGEITKIEQGGIVLQAGKEYVVSEIIDLKGRQVDIPTGVTFSFVKNGAIINGTLNGSDTRIGFVNEGVLGVRLKGTWRVDTISDKVFSRDYLSDTDIINNLNAIQSDDINNTIVVTRDYTITIAKSGGSGIDLKSNTSLLLDGTISLAPNNYTSYSVIKISGRENVIVRGGRIVGDVGKHTYVKGSTSEWGMGISIVSSQDVTIDNVYVACCTGDGIYISGGAEPSIGVYGLASHNVRICDVTSDSNRRQGLSIIHVDGLIVKDCLFVNTGQIEYLTPESGNGIDIEPNVKNGRNMSVRNVLVDHCNITNNRGAAVSNSTSYEFNGKVNHENIIFSNCVTDGLLKAQSTGVSFKNCSFKEIRFASMYTPTFIRFDDCEIMGGYGIRIYTPLLEGVSVSEGLLAVDFNNCTVSVSEEKTNTSALIICKKDHVPNIISINFNHCHLVVPETKKGRFNLTDHDFLGKLHIISSIIEMKGRDVNLGGIDFQKNTIRCKSVVNMSLSQDNSLEIQ